VPDKGNPQGLDRYAYAANNPISRVDTGGHCWGIAGYIRGLPSYNTTCNNLNIALTIIKSEEASASDKVLAGAYITGEFLAHGTAIVYGGLLACGLASGACYTALTAGPGVLEAACKYGNCAERIKQANEAINNAVNSGSSSNPTFTSNQVDAVQHYLSSSSALDDAFDPNISPYNIAMVQRQRDIIAGELAATQYDVNFMQHELFESQLVGSGMDQQLVHQQALKTYGISGDWDLYATEVYDQFTEWMWNPLWEQHMGQRAR
jgi:hypothetical protein